jgi:molybdopterin/thiamine biosynthesis adenylyltransferase
MDFPYISLVIINIRIVSYMFERYSRQTVIPEIGIEGQNRLSKSCAVVIGCGALGSVIASALVRAAVGKVKIIDRDFIEYHNLQRSEFFVPYS